MFACSTTAYLITAALMLTPTALEYVSCKGTCTSSFELTLAQPRCSTIRGSIG